MTMFDFSLVVNMQYFLSLYICPLPVIDVDFFKEDYLLFLEAELLVDFLDEQISLLHMFFALAWWPIYVK
jgi:hypothetical protein